MDWAILVWIGWCIWKIKESGLKRIKSIKNEEYDCMCLAAQGSGWWRVLSKHEGSVNKKCMQCEQKKRYKCYKIKRKWK